MPQSGRGRLRVWDDFESPNVVTLTDGATLVVGHFGLATVGTTTAAVMARTIDEPGGITAFTVAIDDNNVALFTGRFKPADGGMVMEARFKFSSITLCAVFVGFSETLSLSVPVMPAELSGSTATYNGTGGMLGLAFDPDATTDDFRAVGADGGAATGDADTNGGTRAVETITADEFYIAKVEVYSDGKGACYLGHKGGLGGSMNLVKRFNTAPITPTDMFYAVLMFENRGGGSPVYEVDYMEATGNRDWAV